MHQLLVPKGVEKKDVNSGFHYGISTSINVTVHNTNISISTSSKTKSFGLFVQVLMSSENVLL